MTPASGDAESTLSSTITFEQPSAARTALLLDNTQLNNVPIQVSAGASLDDLQHNAEHDLSTEPSQEDKPRTAIVAEYLAHGYVLGDRVLQRSIDFDAKHGYSKRFTNFINDLNNKHKVADKSRAMDSTYGISTKATQGYNTVTRYLETALNTPTGQKVRTFYEEGQKQVLDIHAEARRLADLKAAEEAKNKPAGEASGSTSTEKGGEQLPGYTPGAGSTSTSEKVVRFIRHQLSRRAAVN